MSEPAAKRPSIDFDEFERRLRMPEPVAPIAGAHDPLAELARLVDGGRDPYGDVFGRPSPRANLPGLRALNQVEPPPLEMPTAAPLVVEPPSARVAEAPAVAVPGAEHWEMRQPEWPPTFQQQAQPAPAAIQASQPDVNEDEPEFDYAERVAPKRSRMGLYLVAASVAVVGLGVGATVLTRKGATTAGDAPIIQAAAGPMKVQPEAVAKTDEPMRTASVLDKTTDKIGQSKVVTRDEQPIDLSAAKPVRPATAPAAAATASSSLFPEPRKVRTIPVRPDGSLASEPQLNQEAKAPASAAAPAPTPRPNNMANVTTPSLPQVKLPGATAQNTTSSTANAQAAPKTTTRVTPPVTDAAPTASTRPASPAPAKPAPAKPAANLASLDPAPAAPKASGGAAVQLAAAGSEAEARDKIGKFASQYSGALGGRRPTVVQADVNGKAVWRIRVTGLSREDAVAMCTKIKGSGGTCFVP